MSMPVDSVILDTYYAFHRVVLEAAEPVVVDFTAAWCAPCRSLSPVLAELARHHAGRVRVAVVQVEDAPELAQAYRVTSMPTLIAFHRGQVVAHSVGFSGRAAVEKLFDQLAALAALPARPATSCHDTRHAAAGLPVLPPSGQLEGD